MKGEEKKKFKLGDENLQEERKRDEKKIKGRFRGFKLPVDFFMMLNCKANNNL